MKKLILALFLPLIAFSITGLQKGDKAPNIKLKTISAKTFNLHEQDKKTILVFFRGSWCPYCMAQLKELNKELLPKLDQSKTQLVAISVDRPKVARKMKRKFDLDFTVLSDPKASSLKDYKIVNQLNKELVKKYKNSYKIDVEGDSGETHHMIAHPAVFIVENKKIVFSDVHTDYKERTKIKEILEAL